ncbi:MAG: hypothetical protein ACI4GC_07045 [Acutalibacteraceae bacterium]
MAKPLHCRKATSFVYVRKMNYGLTAVTKSASVVPLNEVMSCGHK